MWPSASPGRRSAVGFYFASRWSSVRSSRYPAGFPRNTPVRSMRRAGARSAFRAPPEDQDEHMPVRDARRRKRGTWSTEHDRWLCRCRPVPALPQGGLDHDEPCGSLIGWAWSDRGRVARGIPAGQHLSRRIAGRPRAGRSRVSLARDRRVAAVRLRRRAASWWDDLRSELARSPTYLSPIEFRISVDVCAGECFLACLREATRPV